MKTTGISALGITLILAASCSQSPTEPEPVPDEVSLMIGDMWVDLEELVIAQANYRADSSRYASHDLDLFLHTGWRPSRNITVRLYHITNDSFAAETTHRFTEGVQCAVYVGQRVAWIDDKYPGIGAGVPECQGGYRPR